MTDTTTTTEGRSFERPVVPLVQQLRDKANAGPQGSIWCDDARRLMLWAARTIEAADAALLENYKHNTERSGAERPAGAASSVAPNQERNDE